MSAHVCACTHTEPFTLASVRIHSPSKKLECGALVLIPRTLYCGGPWPANVSVSAGRGPSPAGVQTHVAFTDLIRRSEARAAASVTFTNTGNGVWERHTPLAHNRLKGRCLYRADPHGRDRNTPSQPPPQDQTCTPHAPCLQAHTHAYMHTHTCGARPNILIPHRHYHTQILLDFKHSC